MVVENFILKFALVGGETKREKVRTESKKKRKRKICRKEVDSYKKSISHIKKTFCLDRIGYSIPINLVGHQTCQSIPYPIFPWEVDSLHIRFLLSA